jgi:oligoendopeptidase F
MIKNKLTAMMISGMMVFAGYDAMAQERDRSKIEDKYKWNLADLYPSNEEWARNKEALKKRLPEIEKFKGTLGRSSKDMQECLDMANNLSKEFGRLGSYASMHSDEDTRVSQYMAMKSEMQQLGTEFGTSIAFIEPEILKIDKAKIETFLSENKGLQVYRKYLFDIIRRKAHTGTESEEKIIAAAGLISSTPSDIYNIFSNADFPFSEVTLSNGQKVKLDQAAFSLHRASPNREDRKKVFAAFFGKVNDYQRTFGTQLYGEIKKNMFYSRVRKYNSSLEAALDVNKIPVEVYHNLIENVNKNLATFHKYLNLRKRILGVSELHYYDLYAPLLQDVVLTYSVEASRKNILASLKPLGSEYTDVVAKAFNERWIDMFPSEGKRSGAYSNGSAYDVHPFILMNYNGKFNDMSTLTHELGHTMQSYFSNKHQPYPLADYPIFVAEVASTFNEALLIDYTLKNIKDDQTRLSILGNYLEGIKGTVFRQTQFAEFEMRIHELAEKGEALTGERFNEVYYELTKKYYGHDNAVCIVDEEIKAEWAYIPHFYYNFYVYQYATSYTASAALSEKALQGEKGAIDKYMKFLSAGGSDYPIELLKVAGVDMTTTQPFDLTMQKMNRVMDEMEAILKRMGK